MRLALLSVFILTTTICGVATAQDKAPEKKDRLGPFTAAVRSVRSREIDQQHIRLELDFDFDGQSFTGIATTRFSPFKPVSSINLDIADMKINGVEDGAGNKLKFSASKTQLRITLGKQYQPGEAFTVKVMYQVVKPKSGAHFVLPDADEPGGQVMVWTQSEPEFARFWFPCIDSPSDRITSEIIATAPADFEVLSNGNLLSRKVNKDKTATWHWAQKKSHVPYLMSVVAGRFEKLEQKWGDVPVVSYVPPGRIEQAARSFEKTPKMMALFSRLIGYRYPWSKYAQICVDEYNWGGMEHTSASTLNLNTLHDKRAHLDVSSDNLVAHELAHQWWGDLLTCKDWGELWLNESFATYFATIWAEHDRGKVEATWQRYREGIRYKSEDKRYRRPIVTYRYNAPKNMFDSHSYPKGARVLHMLRYHLGDALFWKAIGRYAQVNQFRTVETADLRRAIEDATGQGLNWFFDQWVHHGGHPELECGWRYDAKAKMVRLHVKQTQTIDKLTPLFRTRMEIAICNGKDSTIKQIELTKADHTFDFQYDQRPSRVVIDPQDWVLKDLKIDKSKEEWLDQLRHDQHIIPQARAIQALTEYVGDKDVIEQLASTAAAAEFWGVREEAVKALQKFKGDETRQALMAALKDEKSFVRRAAVTALRDHAHKETAAAMREVIKHDESYYAIAAALQTLVKVDRKNCAADLMLALNAEDHRATILRAAIDGLVALKHKPAAEKLAEMLKQKRTTTQRTALLSGLERLKIPGAGASQAVALLPSNRETLRRASVRALAAVGDKSHAAVLLAAKKTEANAEIVKDIDKAVKTLNSRKPPAAGVAALRKEIEGLRRSNKALEARLKKLEQALQSGD